MSKTIIYEGFWMSVAFIIHFDVKKEKLTEFMSLMNSVNTDLPAVNGCINVSVFHNISEPHHYTLVEHWESLEIHKQYVNHLVESGTWDHISSLLEKEPRSGYFDTH